MALIVSKVAQFSGHVFGSVLGRWRQNPGHVFSDVLMVVSLASARLKYIPWSNKIRVVFESNGVGDSFDDFLWNDFLRENESRMLDPGSPKVRRVARVLAKIVRALSDALMLQHDCRVSANQDQNGHIIIPSRTSGKDGRKHNFEHLDGLSWEVVVLDPEEHSCPYYMGHGRIVMDSIWLDSYDSEIELANDLAHEVGHGVAMHAEGCYSKTLTPLALVPWTSALWGPAIFIRLFDMFLYGRRRNEMEADYIGLMLMASAGYDPRPVPEFWKKYDGGVSLDTTHPCSRRRAEMLSQDTVMDRAIQICRQVRAGHGVPSFIDKEAKLPLLFNPNFNPFFHAALR